MKKFVNLRLLAVLLLSVFCSDSLISDIQKDEATLKRIEEDEKQREVFGVYDIQYNTVSNIEFPTTNYGIFGYDVANRIGGGVWPRGTPNQYIFGGGCWLGARKFPTEDRSYEIFYATKEDGVTVDTIFNVPDRRSMGKYCAVTYNPQNARSFMVPGNVVDGLGVDPNQSQKYRAYFSTDYNQDGKPFAGTDGPNWPIWDTSNDPEDTLKYSRYFGFYEDDVEKRNSTTYPRGPAYISGEDIFATFKDTDLTAHDLGIAAAGLGYPLYLQTEITIYSWGFGRYQDFVFVKYNFVNVSEFRRDGLPADTLYDCYMAPIMDVDVARKPFSSAGAANDRVRYYNEDSTYNLAFQWSDGDRGEQGFGFGYLGFDFLESPATITRKSIDIKPLINSNNDTIGFDTTSVVIPRPENNMVRKDRPFYPNSEQLGLTTFQNWNIDDDRRTDESRYNFLSEGVRETDNGPGDKRFMMVTGPFNMRPGDSVRVVVGIALANTCTGAEATGETEDICELVALDEFMQSVYDNNFRAPLPPDPSRAFGIVPSGFDTIYNEDGSIRRINETSRGLNNAARFAWDETAELSNDVEEQGLDFLGYRIFRARQETLDTFSRSQIEPGDRGFTSGAGLQGWKQIAQYELPLPFVKSTEYKVGGEESDDFSFQDSIRIVGPYIDPKTNEIDQTKVQVMRFPSRSFQVPEGQQRLLGDEYIPQIYAVDSSFNPWYELMTEMGAPDNRGESNDPSDILDPIADKDSEIMAGALLGYVDLKPSIVRFNPMYFNLVNTKITEADYEDYPDDGFVYFTEIIDTIYYERDVDNVKFFDTIPLPTRENALDSTIVTVVGTDTTWRYFTFRKDSYESPTSELNFIVDMDSYTPEVEVQYFYTTDTVIDARGDTTTFDRLDSISSTPTGFFTVNARFPKTDTEIGNIMNFSNYERLQETLDTIYRALAKGTSAAELSFPDFSGSDVVKERIILPVMDRLTNGRTFFDTGDDNNNNTIDLSDDVNKTEKLINQLPYYYRILAYDEGHVNSGSQKKSNSGKQKESPNVVEIFPTPVAVGEEVSFDLIAADSSLLGSLNSFELFAIDPDRSIQLFQGDTIQVKFKSNQELRSVQYTNGRQQTTTRDYGLYSTEIEITNLSEQEEMYSTDFFYEGTLGATANFNLPTENTFSIVLADTVVIETNKSTGDTIHKDDIGTPRSNSEIIRGGLFTTGNFRDNTSIYTNRWSEKSNGTLSFEFNYYLKQFGGMFRPDSTVTVVSDDYVTTRIQPWDSPAEATQADPIITNTTQVVGFDDGESQGISVRPIQVSQSDETGAGRSVSPLASEVVATFNNGPGTYRMILGPELTREVSFAYRRGAEEKTFIVPYHEVTIVNETEYLRPLNERGDSVIVDMSQAMEHIDLPVNKLGKFIDPSRPQDDEIGTPYPSPINLYEAGEDPAKYLGNYNITTYGFHDARVRNINQLTVANKFVFPGDEQLAQDIDSIYTGLQGVYVKSATSTDGQDVIDFVNLINIAGVNFYSDFANVGRFQVGNEQFRRPIGSFVQTLELDEFDPNAENQIFDSFEEVDGKYEVKGLKRFITDLGENDEVVFRTKGGVIGLPYDGATLTYVVNGGEPGDDPTNPTGYTDDMLNGINVVPNPYYITHQAQKSPYDAKIYFNKLPPVCTIEIYTVSGDLVRTLEHDQFSGEEDKEAIEVFDLLTDSGLRVQSQSLVARIYTPDGAETLKTFSLVVGSFRIVQDQ